MKVDSGLEIEEVDRITSKYQISDFDSDFEKTACGIDTERRFTAWRLLNAKTL
jgi:hypothetical protein